MRVRGRIDEGCQISSPDEEEVRNRERNETNSRVLLEEVARKRDQHDAFKGETNG